MRFVYKPEGSEPQSWEINLGRFKVGECEAIEARTGMAFGSEFKEALLSANATARRALLWTLQRRTHHTIRYQDIDFYDDEVLLEFDRDELTEMLNAMEQAPPGLNEDKRQATMLVLAAEIASLDVKAAQEDPEPDPGKDPEPETLPESATATG